MAAISPHRTAPPAARTRLERMREGAGALVLVAQTLWREPALRRLYLRVAIAQSALTLFFGAFVAWRIFVVDGESGRPKDEPAKHVALTFDDDPRTKVQGTVIDGDEHTVAIGADVVADADDAAEDANAKGADAEVGRASGAKNGDGAGEDPAASAPVPATSLWARLGKLWGTLVKVYTALVVIGWVIIALSRDYHDAIGRELSLRLDLPPEDPPVVPRVRVNFGWMATRMKRRLRGFMLFTLGVPPLWALSCFVVLPLLGLDLIWNVFDTSSVVSRLYGLLAAAWGAYWLVVFTTAKTVLAWAEEGTAPDPWFLRLWGALTARLPRPLASLPRGYGRAWRAMSRRVFSPAICFERAPYEFTGLAALRLLCSVPIFYPFVRPFVPVAAALIVSRHASPAVAKAPAPS